MDSYLKPDEKIEKYEKIQEKEEKRQEEEAAKLRKKKRRRIRAKNFKAGRILLHATHSKDGKARKILDFKDHKCIIL